MSCKNLASARLRETCHIIQHSKYGPAVLIQPCRALSTTHTGVIQVTPKVSLFDQKVHIKVQGLSSNAKVTLHLATEQEWRRSPALFVSCSHHVARQTGELDLNTDSSLGGTYTGVDPMGLFWSMHPDPSGPQNTRMVVKNVDEPCLYTLSLYDGHLTLDDLHASGAEHQPLLTTTITKLKKSVDVKRFPVRDGGVRGILFLPAGEGPHPGVIDMFGTAGGVMEVRAALLASHGFATLALPFFRYDDLPSTLEEVQFQYFEEASEWLSSHKAVRDGGIGVVGVSKGAEFALIMAWQCPQVESPSA
ncbi:hypothetical protein BaRGS_00031290 [Batillaria attramentaria]|uniref:Uncharacterized protein n=1 Tax=Batillaria attramentaria TaxID=370345 RepID=A0ABD0JRT7_9CAEN